VFNTPAGGTDSLGRNKAWWQDSAIAAPYETGLSLAYRKKFGNLDLTAGGYYFKQNSFRAGEFDHRGRVSLLTRYRVPGVDGLTVGMNVNTQYGESGSFFIWNGLGAESYRYWETVGAPTQTDGFRLTVDPFLTYFDDAGNRHRVQLRYNQVDNDNTNNQGNFSKFYYGEYQFQRRWEELDFSISTGAVANYVTVRADLYADSVKVDGRFEQVGDPLDGSNFAGYLQLDKRFFDKLNLSFGARLEANRISFTDPEQKVVFRAGANYQAAEFTFIRASWGQGYRFPTIAEKFIQTALGGGEPSFLNPSILPNPDLVSETGWNAEIGIKQGLRIGKFDAFLDVAAFYQEYLDMMEFVFFQPTLVSTGFQSRNIGDTRIYGLEVGLAGRGNIGDHPINLGAGYTWANPEYQDFNEEINDLTSSDENVLTYRNRHTFKAEGDIQFGSVMIGTNLQYYSYMESIDKIFEVLLPGVEDWRAARTEGGDWIWDLRAGVDIGDHWSLAAIVKNVMNREYAIRPARMDPPRNYTLRLTYTLGS
jgi:iron complex outermembrane receptor protein